MTQNSTSTRRAFLKGGALLSAPIAATSVATAALADDGLRSRVARLEDDAAIRDLHRSWLRQVNSGERNALPDPSVRRISVHPVGAPDRIEIAADGRSAVGRFDCAVEVEAPLAKDSTLAQMAHAQGHGTVRHTERRMLTIGYIKSRGAWKIERAELRSA